MSKIGARIIDELVSAMKEIQLDDEELACVKALVFFDPSEFLNQNYNKIGNLFVKIFRCKRLD